MSSNKSVTTLPNFFDSKKDHFFEIFFENLSLKIATIDYNKQMFILLTVNDLSDKMNLLSLDTQNNFKTLLISSLSHELSNPLHFLVNTLECMKQLVDPIFSNDYDTEHQFNHLTGINEARRIKLIKPEIEARPSEMQISISRDKDRSDDRSKIVEANHALVEMNKMLPMMVANIRKYSLLVNSFLDYSLIMTQKFSLHVGVFNLKKVLTKTVYLFSEDASYKGITLSLSMYKDVPETWINDEDRMAEVLYHLLSNSLKFTNSGEVEVIVSHDKEANSLCISVRDSGIGLTLQQLERLTQLLKNGTTSSKVSEESAGEGVGLVITQSILRHLSPQSSDLTITTDFKLGCVFKFNIQLMNNQIEGSKHLVSSNVLLEHEIVINQIQEFIKNRNMSYSEEDKNISSDCSAEYEINQKMSPKKSPDKMIPVLSLLDHTTRSKIAKSSLMKIPLQLKSAGGSSLGRSPNQREILLRINEKKKVKNKTMIKPVATDRCQCKKILIVDDDHQNIKITSRILDTFKFEVLSANDGASGVTQVAGLLDQKCCSKCRVLKLIFMDCNMPPGIDGIEATRQIKELLKEQPIDIPIIGLTAYNDEETTILFKEAGALTVVIKPAKFSIMNKLVQDILKTQQEEDQR